MKKLFTLLSATMLLFSMSALAGAQAAGPKGAQGGPGGPQGGRMAGGRERMKKMRAELLAKLNLSKDQKTKIDALDKKYEADMKKLFESSKGDRESMRSKARPMMEARDKAFAKILTAAQLKKYEQLRKEQMDKMRKEFGGGMRGRGGPGGAGGGAAGGGAAHGGA